MKFLNSSILLLLGCTAVPLIVVEARFASVKFNLEMAVAEDPHHLTDDMVRICADETNISLDELHKLHKNDFSNSSETVQCYTHCIYEQMGLMRDGVFVEQDFTGTLNDMLDPKHYVAKHCNEIKGENKCETAYKIHQCRQEAREQLAKPNESVKQPHERTHVFLLKKKLHPTEGDNKELQASKKQAEGNNEDSLQNEMMD